jgi:UDP-N-acetylmuramoyl-tripeptide--D-alanyl-D-alanine ligase
MLLRVSGGALWLGLILRRAWVAGRMYQLEEYDARRLLHWLRDTMRPWVGTTTLVGVIAGTLLAAAGGHGAPRELVPAGLIVGGAATLATWRWPAAKKPLVMTSRARRLAIATVLLATACTIPVAALGASSAPGVLLSLAVVPGASVLLLICANVILWPYELRTRAGYVRMAAAKLASVRPLVVAVAGSYGKTTTKRIVAHVLDDGDTWPTPRSVNTLLGIAKTVNDDLHAAHSKFVVEMDPYAPGEIAVMCRLTQPSVAVVTSVGPQHLERFRSMSRVEDALFEVIDGLPREGIAVTYAGEVHAARLSDRARASGRRTIRYGMREEVGDFDVIADSVQLTACGTSFTWCWQAEGLELAVTVPLLGRHQVLNASAALIVAHVLHRPLDDAVARLRTLEPVEHRLQPLASGNGIAVIDDSYNANPVGVHNALEVLQSMDVNRRILVTPGIVELGAAEEPENRRYGAHAARVCDHVILVRARTLPALLQGLREGGMATDRVHVVKSLDEATAVMASVARSGDAVLFANDLPDTY